MYEDIYNLIEYDSIAANRKFGIKLLTPNNAQNDVFTINYQYNFSESLDDEDKGVRFQAIDYYSSINYLPNAEVLRKIFRMMQTDEYVKEKCAKLLSKFKEAYGYKTLCDGVVIAGNQKAGAEFQGFIEDGFSELLKKSMNDVQQLIDELLPRLLNEKEKIDLASLFLLKICFSVLKDKDKPFFDIAYKHELETHKILSLLDFFIINKEDCIADYYFKLQNMINISNIDMGEDYREQLINKFFFICKKVPLNRFKIYSNATDVDKELVENIANEKIYENTLRFARNEEDIISLVISSIKDIYKYSESLYLSQVKQNLIDEVIKGVTFEERNDGRVIPLKLKIEKKVKELRLNEEKIQIYNESIRSSKSNLIEVKDFDECKLKIEQKLNKIQNQADEKQYRGLLIILYVLKNAKFSHEINPEFSCLSSNFICEQIDNKNLFIASLALSSLGYSCLLSKSQSSDYVSKFQSKIAQSFQSISLVAIMFIFDILLLKKLNDEKIPDIVNFLEKSMNESREMIKFVVTEGFCKLLTKKMIASPELFLTKLFFIRFKQSTSQEICQIINAFMDNYVRISEDTTTELVNAFLVYILLTKKQASIKVTSIEKSLIEIVKFFDPAFETNYEKTENLHFLIFNFCYENFNKSKKFLLKIICRLNFEKFKKNMCEFVKNRLNQLKNENSSMSKNLQNCIARLPNDKDIVEDITYREYQLRIEDIRTKAMDYQKKYGIS